MRNRFRGAKSKILMRVPTYSELNLNVDQALSPQAKSTTSFFPLPAKAMTFVVVEIGKVIQVSKSATLVNSKDSLPDDSHINIKSDFHAARPGTIPLPRVFFPVQHGDGGYDPRADLYDPAAFPKGRGIELRRKPKDPEEVPQP